MILTVYYRLPSLPIRVENRSIGTTDDVRANPFAVARPELTNAIRGGPRGSHTGGYRGDHTGDTTRGTEHQMLKLVYTAVLKKLCPRRQSRRRHAFLRSFARSIPTYVSCRLRETYPSSVDLRLGSLGPDFINEKRLKDASLG